MIGLVLLAVSWMLLRLEGKGLSALGIDRPARRVVEFAAGGVLLGLAAAVQQLGGALATGDSFVANTDAAPSTLLQGARFVLDSVVYEELLFRGYLLYRAVRWLGPQRAVWLDAAVFEIYHWFSYGVLGQPIAMAYVLVMTGAIGLMLARAFTTTGSIAAPLGMHLGWNAVTQLLFSSGPLGAMVLVPASGVAGIDPDGAWHVLLSVVWPLVVVAAMVQGCRWHEKRRAAAFADTLPDRDRD